MDSKYNSGKSARHCECASVRNALKFMVEMKGIQTIIVDNWNGEGNQRGEEDTIDCRNRMR